MIEQKYITPRAGILVPLPDGNGYLPPKGKLVALNSYWYQRQTDGDVTIADVPPDGDVTIADMVHATDVRPVSALGTAKTKNK